MSDEPPLGFTVALDVPGTTGNLGPGFDTLGMALDLRNSAVIRVTGRGSGQTVVEVQGEGSAELVDVERNRLVTVLRSGLETAGLGDLELAVEQTNRIPLRRGLGSSGAAAVAGALGALALAGGPEAVTVDAAVRLALPTEGHPDNLIPSLVGGLCICWSEADAGDVRYLRLDPPSPQLTALLWVPEAEVATADARGALPATVPLEDAVFSASRTALLVAAVLQGRTELLATATQDRLHQPCRIGLLPAMGTAIEAALDAGALAAWVSGSGSSVLALCDPARGLDGVSEALTNAFGVADAGQVVRAGLADDGARVTVEGERWHIRR